MRRGLDFAGADDGNARLSCDEQATDASSVDIRADLYSLGCTLYHLLAGRPPFGTPEYAHPARKLSAHLHDPIPPITDVRPELPGELLPVLDKLLARDPGLRYGTPGEVADALQPFCTGCDLTALHMNAAPAGPAAPGVVVAGTTCAPITQERDEGKSTMEPPTAISERPMAEQHGWLACCFPHVSPLPACL